MKQKTRNLVEAFVDVVIDMTEAYTESVNNKKILLEGRKKPMNVEEKPIRYMGHTFKNEDELLKWTRTQYEMMNCVTYRRKK